MIPTSKYEFLDVFYADLTVPIEEIEKYKNFLVSQKSAEIYFISVNFTDDTLQISEVSCKSKVDDFNKFIFVNSNLVGTGVNHFIVETDLSDIEIVVKDFFTKMTIEEYDSNLWIENFLNLGIIKVHKAYADGGVVFTYEKGLPADKTLLWVVR